MISCKKDLADQWPVLLFDLLLGVLALFAAMEWLSDWFQGRISWKQGGFYVFPALLMFVWFWIRTTIHRVSSTITEIRINDDGMIEFNSPLRKHAMSIHDARVQ
jgi:hypothetical protein